MLSPIAIGYIWRKCEPACEPGHVVEGGIIASGARRLVSLGRIPVNFSCKFF